MAKSQKRTLVFRFIISALIAYIVASILHSQFILAGLVDLDIEITFADRLQMTGSDLLGLLPGYGSVVAIALLVGFLSINAVNKWLVPINHTWRYPIAGFVAMGAALMAMQPLLDVTLIASARTTFGFVCQCLAGALGGVSYAYLTNPSAEQTSF